MMKSIFVLLTGVILFSGMFVVGLNSSDAFAEKGGNDKQEAKGCQNANNEKMKEKNKHCGINGNANGVPQPIPTSNTCDGSDGSLIDGAISAAELPISLDQNHQDFIDIIEDLTEFLGGDTGNTGVIDTLDEWDTMQDAQLGLCT